MKTPIEIHLSLLCTSTKEKLAGNLPVNRDEFRSE